ncbi:unnamed protein product [Amoebophrya sp. A25]|nr:unnamed protein product [Amoebophrya sp. A25]|eukprot:GSA25T00026790001.1
MHLHAELHLVHRDVKSQNVVVRGTQLKLCDFGKTRKLEDKADLLKSIQVNDPSQQVSSRQDSGTPLSPQQLQAQRQQLESLALPRATLLTENGGSPRYMPREAFFANRFVTERVDAWAFGCFLLESWTQKVPWHEVASSESVVDLVVHQERAPNVDLLPPALKGIAQALFRVDPAERPCMAEVLYFLRRHKHDIICGEQSSAIAAGK